jgi:peptidyl-prolyl cis-trans isomerase A (cyclophilin A)
VFCFVLSLYSCQKNSKDTIQKNSVQKKNSDSIENKIPKPKYDLKTVVITEENVVDFLTWYGEQNTENKVKIECSFGTLEVELFEQTPLHRANFIYLVKKNYFNTTYFHRVVKNFIVQGGNSDETITQKERKNIGKYFVPAEFVKSYKHHYGALASARTWEDNPDKLSNPFEFYFVQNKGGAHHLDGEHTVFGKITSGFEVLDEIASQKTDEGEYPLLNIKIKVTLSE